MKRLLLLIFNLILLSQIKAQDQTNFLAADSTVVDDAKPRFVQPSFTFDYGKSVVNLFGREQKFEAGLTFLFFDQYYATVTYGNATLNPENALENGHYTSEGSYYRLGGGYLTNLNQRSKLGLGVRYAQSSFEEYGDILVESATGVQDDYSKKFNRPNLTGRWIELVLTSESKIRFNKENTEAKINQLFSLGFFFRLRFMSSYERFQPIDVYSIPGYGKVINDPVPAINLYLRFHPF